jgi:hypothetical protein
MKSLRRRVTELRTMLQTADDFSPVLNDFFDLVEDEGFMGMGRRVRDPKLEGIVARAGTQMVSAAGAVPVEVMIIRVSELGITHGMLSVGGHAGGFFYFPALDQGLASVTLAGGATAMARFTVKALDGDPAVLVAGNDTVH